MCGISDILCVYAASPNEADSVLSVTKNASEKGVGLWRNYCIYGRFSYAAGALDEIRQIFC